MADTWPDVSAEARDHIWDEFGESATWIHADLSQETVTVIFGRAPVEVDVSALSVQGNELMADVRLSEFGTDPGTGVDHQVVIRGVTYDVRRINPPTEQDEVRVVLGLPGA